MLGMLCATCSRKDYEPNLYVVMLHRIHILQTAGFPMGADDLSLETWLDLGIIKKKIQARNWGNGIDQ